MPRQNRPSRKGGRNQLILQRYQAGEKPKTIAMDYAISPGRVRQIIQREQRWQGKQSI